jgi:hypothetical protein
MKPTLFFGGAGTLLQADRTYADAGEPYELRARPNAVAPAGAGGECAFGAVYLVLTFSMPFSIRVTPVLDGIAYYDESIGIANDNPMAVRETHIFEMPFVQREWRDGVDIRTRAFRGTWWTVEIGMPCPPADAEGDLLIEGVEVEYEVLSEGGR